MEAVITGTVAKFGDNINTDIISPPQYMELPIQEAAKYAMSAVDESFAAKAGPGTIVVAGGNFGSGSSRETAPLTLRHLGIKAIVAKSFARIFYRNGINLAGVGVFEASLAGLGGCPFAPGAAGNTATEDLLNLLAAMGMETGIGLRDFLGAVETVVKRVEATAGGHVYKLSAACVT